jgi:2-polyprenyl-3-methyl-5-hydroxy-6-metoxy-1,4-benzoquinol methylase
MLCGICGREFTRAVGVREMMLGYRDTFTYLECAECQCLQLAAIPGDLSRYYPATYYSFTHSPVENLANPIKRIIRRCRDRYAALDRGLVGKLLYQRFPNEPLRSLSGVNRLTRGSRVLDVGCGSGGLLFSLQELGFERLLGIDPYLKKDFEYANGLRVLKKSLADLGGEWDLVMFHHSFEHSAAPLELLRRAVGLLAPGGVCLIRMPTIPCYAWEHYGVNWVQLDAPRHAFIHSTTSVQRLAEQAGLQLEKVVHDSTAFQFWGSEQYLRDIPLGAEHSYAINPAKSIFSRKEIAGFQERAKILNRQQRGDAAAFYLCKAADYSRTS